MNPAFAPDAARDGFLFVGLVVANLAAAAGVLAVLLTTVRFSPASFEALARAAVPRTAAAGCLLLLAVALLLDLGSGVWIGAVLKLAAGAAGLYAATALRQNVKLASSFAAPARQARHNPGFPAFALVGPQSIMGVPPLPTRAAAPGEDPAVVEMRMRLTTALRDASARAFSQDRELRYTWVCDPAGEAEAKAMLGRTDAELLPDDVRDTVIALKQNVLRTGKAASCEIASTHRGMRALYALHIAPFFGSAGEILGLTGSAVDLLRLRPGRSGAEDQDQAAARMRTALHHYEIALRGSHVTLFTLDRDLRFTSLSNPLFGKAASEVVGQACADALPAGAREQFSALMHSALINGRSQSGEVSVREGDKTQWYELHVEPLPDETGVIAGVTCALFDITERKTHEGHLRLIMRELTHRSKNLLAVIQSMARQTGRHAGSIDDFLDAFGDRLQAIATSHDLLVQEGWYGASLHDLTHRQLAKYIDGAANRVKLSGPAVHLKPAAAQSFGLALHELASNAERFGALSIPEGCVEINWRRQRVSNTEDGIEIIWAEHGGPDVTAPTSRGFGSLVVEKNLSRALDAEVNLTFEPSGVRCRMLIPPSHLLNVR